MPAVGSAHPAHCRLGFHSTYHPSGLSRQTWCVRSPALFCALSAAGTERNYLQLHVLALQSHEDLLTSKWNVEGEETAF